MIKKGIVLLIMFLLMSTVLISNASATSYDESKSIRIEEGQYWTLFLSGLSSGDDIDVEIDVTEGGNVDVMIMDSINFNSFKDASNAGYGEWMNIKLVKNTKGTSISVSAPEDGDYYVVIDNTDVPSGGASPSGYVDVTVDIQAGTSASFSCCLSTMLVLGGVLVAFGACLLLIRKRK